MPRGGTPLNVRQGTLCTSMANGVRAASAAASAPNSSKSATTTSAGSRHSSRLTFCAQLGDQRPTRARSGSLWLALVWAWSPASKRAADQHSFKRVINRLRKRDEHRPRRSDSVPEAVADCEPAPPNAGASQHPDLMAARHKLGDDWEDEGDISAALEHCEDESYTPASGGMGRWHPILLSLLLSAQGHIIVALGHLKHVADDGLEVSDGGTEPTSSDETGATGAPSCVRP